MASDKDWSDNGRTAAAVGLDRHAKAGILLEPGEHQVNAILRNPRAGRNETTFRPTSAAR